MPWCLRSMFSSEQQENSHIIMIKILTCHMNYKICHLSARSHIAQTSLSLRYQVYSFDFFKERTLIPAFLSNSLSVAFGAFCNVSCKLDQRNLCTQTDFKKWYVVLLVQILLQKSFFIQNPQGYQNDIKANKTIYYVSVLVVAYQILNQFSLKHVFAFDKQVLHIRLLFTYSENRNTNKHLLYYFSCFLYLRNSVLYIKGIIRMLKSKMIQLFGIERF